MSSPNNTEPLKQQAFDLVGYTVIEREGWVVKEYPDGRIERIVKIAQFDRPNTLSLD